MFWSACYSVLATGLGGDPEDFMGNVKYWHDETLSSSETHITNNLSNKLNRINTVISLFEDTSLIVDAPNLQP